ncbi:MAG TPA: FliH/SctL family protein [Tepidisphaeraceae bacterium]|nr:FliH/SctL family protein [Tepidisphaeraceae bacterium]
MGLIKSTAPRASQARSFSIRDVEAYARQLIERAQQQSDELLASAAADAEQLKAAAHAQGLAEGRRLGQQQGIEQGRAKGRQEALDAMRDQLIQLFNAFTGATAEIEGYRQQLVADCQADLVRLALSIADRVARHRGRTDPTVLHANVVDAVRLAVRKSDLRIAIHPSQHQLLESIIPQLQLQWPELKHVAIVDDDRLAPGGCRVQTVGGEIDADLQTQIECIAAELLPESQAE